MLKYSAEVLSDQTEKFYKSFKKSLITSVKYDDFIEHVMKSRYGDKKIEPKEIRISPPLENLIKGDLTPSQTFIFNPLYLWGDVPMWTGDATEGWIFRGFGYERGDRSKLCSSGVDDTTPHAFLAGSTGSGKTVTINSGIITAAIEYPPWELQFTLIDPKVVEFLNYSKNGVLPHIDVIGATDDADYIISALAGAVFEMDQRMVAFAESCGAQNIRDFKSKTGLTMHQKVIIIDESSSMFVKAKRRIPEISSYIALMAKKGRSAGVHLFLCSQEIPQELPADVLANIPWRGCLGAYAHVSKKIIANEGAAEFFGQKGKLTINLQTAIDNNEKYNQLHYSPYLPGEAQGSMRSIHDYKNLIEEKGKSLGIKPINELICFNDLIIPTEQDFINSLDEFPVKNNKIYLGEPAFVQYWDKIKTVPITLDDVKQQNILVYASNRAKNADLTKMILHNLAKMKKEGEKLGIIYYSIDKNRTKLITQAFPNLFDLKLKVETYAGTLEASLKKVKYRQLCEEVDEELFSGESADLEAVPTELQEIFFNKTKSRLELDKQRCAMVYKIAKNSVLGKTLGVEGKKDDDEQKLPMIMNITATNFSSYPNKGVKFESKYLPKIYHILDSINELKGIGISPIVGKDKTNLATIIREASEYGHNIIATTTNMEEFYSELTQSFDYRIGYQLTGAQIGHLKFRDDYPESISDTLAVLCKAQESDVARKTLKFKIFINN